MHKECPTNHSTPFHETVEAGSSRRLFAVDGKTCEERQGRVCEPIGLAGRWHSAPSIGASVLCTPAMEMLRNVMLLCSLLAADLMPRLVIILDRLSLSFEEAEEVHPSLIPIIVDSLRLAAPPGLACGTIKDENEQQAVCERVLRRVVCRSPQLMIVFVQSCPSFSQSPFVPLRFGMSGGLWMWWRNDGYPAETSKREECGRRMEDGFWVAENAEETRISQPLRLNSPKNTFVRMSTARLSSSFVSDDVVSPFLNWSDDDPGSENEKAIVFRSLVATLKSHPALDASLEAKAVKLLKSITTPAMEMLASLIRNASSKRRLALVKADLIPQLIPSLNLLSLPFAEAVDIHINLMKTIICSTWLATPNCLKKLGIEDGNGQQAVYDTILKQVLVPSEKYIRHLCVNRFSIIDAEQSENFLLLLTHLVRISPYYQPTMEIVLHMPVVLTIPSCLTFFERDSSIWDFLIEMNNHQREWNEQSGEVREMGKTVHRMLRMEGMEDVIEAKLRNDQNNYFGRAIVEKSIRWNNLFGTNLPYAW
ncbi:hypothetical protein BLNAU_7503 [Blattamonas nauphoetae]|uniref:Uncharacterized protein n=1 Tax=Blattamonas nauphoetae TaxID=2049346 RepID=A0ABQ9Y1N4_9EUKA|nr:hypothetical protein BLNAU_7503 [Blattamonas nauphoetae]